MKPNFALSLSQDGILLLNRTAAGWQLVGTADPTSEGLDEALAAMRRTATALTPSGMRCKLIIPHDQIRYLTVETPGLETDARQDAARVALEGATPYDVADLVFDIEEDGDQTHIAAVARETLTEAETFASEHGYAPVSFVAIPNDVPFSKEPFFGPTQASKDILLDGEELERDTQPIRLPEQSTASTTEAADGDVARDVGEHAEESAPSFVSRRRVPTFRSDPQSESFLPEAKDAVLQGFSEPQAPFEPAPPKAKQDFSAGYEPSSTHIPAPAPIVRRHQNDAERFTIFGARAPNKTSGRMGGFGALLLLSIALFAGVGAFATGAFGTNAAELWARLTASELEPQFTAPILQEAPEPVVETLPQELPVELASVQRGLTEEDAAVLDALRAPEITEEPREEELPSPDDMRAAYAVSGIWPIAPDVPSPPALVDLEDLYVTSIDPINPNFDAVALPALTARDDDNSFLAPASPAPAGTVFVFDARGMVIPSPEGSMNPDGILVFAGPPPARQPGNLVKSEDPDVDLSERLRLAAFRPQVRPSDLIETSERAAFSGLTRSELSELRPKLRPQSAQENARASASLVRLDGTSGQSLLETPSDKSFDGATARAVVASLRPDARPNDFSKTVAKIRSNAPAPQLASTARVAPRVVIPKIPSSASVSREATLKNAINLRQVNLIGVYGKPSSRRALVRLGNGSYKKVQVGDSIDGGQIVAIGDSELRYNKRGRAVVLKMPRG